jgi:exodeoxyribonuclease VII large subunit
MPDDLPSLADLRRKTPRRPARPAGPSLFDAPPEVTAADILAEQERSLQTPSGAGAAPIAAPPAPSATAHVFTVGELVRTLRSLVERTYAQITVEGEISNWRPAASGHCYFTLKDGEAQLSVVLFRRQAQLLRFGPRTATPFGCADSFRSTTPVGSSSSSPSPCSRPAWVPCWPPCRS